MMARKTTTSVEVKQRWMEKAYQRYIISLRYDTDQEIIDYVEANKEKLGTTVIFRDAMAMYLESMKKER